MDIRIGIDLGGTKIEAIALASGSRELFRERVATPTESYDHILAAICALVERARGAAGHAASIGVAIPGSVSPATGLVKNANTTALIGHALGPDLEQRLGQEVRLANDANCFALSEAVDGAAVGAAVVFGVIIGTGTGGGLVVQGRVITGPNAIAGEWGHNPLPWPNSGEIPGPACYCGKTGCIETFLSGPGLARDYQNPEGGKITAREIALRAARGEPAAEQALGRYENRMARALAGVINLLDPDIIVLGGGLSGLERLYDSVPRLWPAFVFSDPVETRLAPARHGDSSGVRGAAWLWPPAGQTPL